jgi:hypothetical protein
MQVAGTTLNDIVKATESTNVAFVKECYEFKKIRDRQHEPNFNNVVGLMVTKISALAQVKVNYTLKKNNLQKVMKKFLMELKVRKLTINISTVLKVSLNTWNPKKFNLMAEHLDF